MAFVGTNSTEINKDYIVGKHINSQNDEGKQNISERSKLCMQGLQTFGQPIHWAMRAIHLQTCMGHIEPCVQPYCKACGNFRERYWAMCATCCNMCANLRERPLNHVCNMLQYFPCTTCFDEHVETWVQQKKIHHPQNGYHLNIKYGGAKNGYHLNKKFPIYKGEVPNSPPGPPLPGAPPGSRQ